MFEKLEASRLAFSRALQRCVKPVVEQLPDLPQSGQRSIVYLGDPAGCQRSALSQTTRKRNSARVLCASANCR